MRRCAPLGGVVDGDGMRFAVADGTDLLGIETEISDQVAARCRRGPSTGSAIGTSMPLDHGRE